jgi:hypothetical protein
MKIPQGYVLMVLRAIYGLNQSPRYWYKKFTGYMLKLGWRMSAYDPCVFIYDEKCLFMLMHVDDILIFGADLQAILKFKMQMAEEFSVTDEGECFWYFGMHVE